MKIAVECKSPLLQRSLEMFLSKYLSSAKHSDIVIRDEKCIDDVRCFYISGEKESDLVKPFSKSQLILALENRYKSMRVTAPSDIGVEDEEVQESSEPLNFEILQKRIELLTQEYQNNIIKAVRAFYEK